MTEPRPHLAIFRDLPPPIAHVSSIEGVRSVWQEILDLSTSTRITKGLPQFVVGVVETLLDHTPDVAIEAIRRGDVAFFVAVQMRLDQLDCAMVSCGRNIARRAPLIRAKWMTSGFVQVAQENLERLGGSWPPKAQPFNGAPPSPSAARPRSERRLRATDEPPPSR